MIQTQDAVAFASMAHAGQVRKYTGDPYIVHPIAGAKAVQELGGDDAMVEAALLHDVVEDTDIEPIDVTLAFGEDVSILVVELTNIFTKERFPQLSRAERKARECDRLSRISDRAKLIKRCDIAHNAGSIIAHDPQFATVWLPEAAALMEVL